MKLPPAVILFFLAPAIAELLLGSSPPSEFFNPFIFLLLASLYGSGAVIVRELKVRWNKGYVSLFILGAAYGIIEEGLMVKSFFDPEWMDLGVLGVYGRWLETNWVWAEWLTIYHAVFSIAIPIVLVELAYPEKRNGKWVGNKKFCGLIILLGLVTAFGNLFLTSYRPPLPQYLLSALTVLGLILFAWKISTKTGKNGHYQVWNPTRFTLVGFITATGFFLFFMAGPYLISQPLILMFLGGGLVFSVFLFLRRFHWDESTSYHKFALSAGALAFLILLTPLHELNTNRLDNTQGMAIIGLVALITLLFLRRKLKLVSSEVNPTKITESEEKSE